MHPSDYRKREKLRAMVRQPRDKKRRKHPPMAGGPGCPAWVKWGAFLMLLAVLGFLALRPP